MKTSKTCLSRMTIALFVAKIYFFSTLLTAQVNGLYLTGNDFKNHKLRFTKEENKKCKIKIHDYSFHAHIKVTYGDSVYHFSKDSVYGYIEDEIPHRFFKKDTYAILNPTETILIYKLMVSAKTKYDEAVYSYYFSKDANSPIYPLTTKNLEVCFETNTAFIKLMDVHFNSDRDLLEYDNIHKMYKINRLLELSKTEK